MAAKPIVSVDLIMDLVEIAEVQIENHKMQLPTKSKGMNQIISR